MAKWQNIENKYRAKWQNKPNEINKEEKKDNPLHNCSHADVQ
jgi:hypothetical protein